jgi:hypothetical protein
MQPPTDDPRSAFTVAQVTYLIENTSSVETAFGMELLNLDLTVAADVSDFVSAGSITRKNEATLHASASFSIGQPLDWGNSIVRPYFTMTGPISSTATTRTTMRFNLGAFYTDTPEEDLAENPPTFDVIGYDILSILDDAVGDAYSVDIGVDYLTRVEEILLARGVTQYQIDQDATGKLVTSPLVWTMDDNVTWLTIVNKLLSSIGYQGIWSDWNGVLRCQTYTTPSARASEWTMNADINTTILTERRKRLHDFYSAPNRWVFYWTNNTDGPAPVDGAGRYEFINTTVGDTSVEARGGRTITKTLGLDVADQTSLVLMAQQTIDADMLVPTTIEHETAPFPLAWHFDKYTIDDPDLGTALDVLAASWTFNLDGSDMQHEWGVL